MDRNPYKKKAHRKAWLAGWRTAMRLEDESGYRVLPKKLQNAWLCGYRQCIDKQYREATP